MKCIFFLAAYLGIVSSVYAVEVTERQGADDNQAVQLGTGIWVPVTLEVKPVKGDNFEFGKSNELEFLLTNVSNWRIVVTVIEPTVNKGDGVISLCGSIYGSVRKDPQKNSYKYNRMSQRRTQQSFFDGFLLPGECITVHHTYMPVSRKEEFRISYFNLDKWDSSKKEQNVDIEVYIPETNTETTAITYRPFDMKRWKELDQTKKPIKKIGADCSYRAVLIPDLTDWGAGYGDPNRSGWSRTRQGYTKVVQISYKEPSFYLEDALSAAERIYRSRKEYGAVYEIVYCQSLGGYLVLRRNHSWLLSDSEQTDQGVILAGVPRLLAKEIDSKGSVRVKVGDNQEGFGPDVKKADWKLWDSYPVFYGDGMYTRGEFIKISKEQLLEFLTFVYQKDLRLKQHYYYFDSVYYILEKTEPRKS